MTTKPQNDLRTDSISNGTKDVIHEFVRGAVSRLSEMLKDSPLDWEDDTRWERGTDGHFRVRKKRLWKWWALPNHDWLFSLPDYETCVERLKSDVIVGPHLDSLVGTNISTSIVQANQILESLIYAMIDDEGRLVFTDKQCDGKWREWISLFDADRIACMMVAPLPYLDVPVFPIRLNNDLVLDRLTDDEVTRCYQVGVIRPNPLRFPVIYKEVGVGIRKTTFSPKLILKGNEPHDSAVAEEEGDFGNRPLLRDDLVIEDVISALRLFKHSQIQPEGLARWIDAISLDNGTTFQILGHHPKFGKYELSESEVPQFLELWRLLEEGAANFIFSIHRFNLSFDRRLLADRIVDLVIAAESLFLRDVGDEKYRGEIRYRFSLRAAKFIEHPNFSEHEVFRKMRDAYDARSAIVHGGSAKDITLTFIEEVEELVRLGLRKAILMRNDGNKLRQPEYWNTLIFSEKIAVSAMDVEKI